MRGGKANCGEVQSENLTEIENNWRQLDLNGRIILKCAQYRA
jgi:hypothetical protein